MRIAIHKSNWGFSQDWIAYCEREGLEYKIVNCYDSDIVQQVGDCQILLWHHHHSDARDVLFAKSLLFSLQHTGKIVFPDFNTGWHFDDKVGQKYLLEAIGVAVSKSWVFYEKDVAIKWVKSATFPKVFKLRGGAGSSNVKLVPTKGHALNIVNQSFGKGFSSYDAFNDFKDRLRKFSHDGYRWLDLAKSIRRLITSTRFARTIGRQKGYAYFQEFYPGNSYDIRIVVIAGKRAFGIKRLVRPKDFRASGSGLIKYQKNEVDQRCVQVAFEVAKKLKGQCVAFDFVFDLKGNPKIVEINYGYDHKAYFDCPGYWDDSLKWHKGKFNSAEWIVELMVNEYNEP